MAVLQWGLEGEKFIQAGVDRGVLYPYNPDSKNENSKYCPGEAWNGLTSVSDSPSGAESNKQWADNGVYANIRGAEELGGSIECFTFPDGFYECNGMKEIGVGVYATQQSRKTFGFSYRSLIGSDTQDLGVAGYKIYLIYGATVSPSEESHETLNESPEGETMSFEYDTVPVVVDEAGTIKKTSRLIIDSRHTTAAGLTALENALYGTENTEPYLPMPAEVITLCGVLSNG
jgi:hypothetical protein